MGQFAFGGVAGGGGPVGTGWPNSAGVVQPAGNQGRGAIPSDGETNQVAARHSRAFIHWSVTYCAYPGSPRDGGYMPYSIGVETGYSSCKPDGSLFFTGVFPQYR